MFLIRKPVVRPEPPCGEPTHYSWTESNWPCPSCAAQAGERRKQKERLEFAEMVADAVVRKLRDDTGHNARLSGPNRRAQAGEGGTADPAG